jgi:hypothetical protein
MHHKQYAKSIKTKFILAQLFKFQMIRLSQK